MAKNKERLDKILVDLGYFETKSQAQAAILAKNVKINDNPITKAGYQLVNDGTLNISVKTMPYVSRGAFKLEKAIKAFDIDLKEKICLDAGASTGGFTDFMLQNKAQKIYAVDVGYGQLAWKLRNDDKVIVIERTNIRNCTKEQVYIDNPNEYAQFASMDLSFISITKVLENIKNFMNPDKQEIVALIKPQFEAGKEQVPKSGVIKDKQVHINVIKKVIDFACTIGLFPVDLTYSPVKGPAGNIEYLVYLTNKEHHLEQNYVKRIVDNANEQLNN